MSILYVAHAHHKTFMHGQLARLPRKLRDYAESQHTQKTREKFGRSGADAWLHSYVTDHAAECSDELSEAILRQATCGAAVECSRAVVRKDMGKSDEWDVIDTGTGWKG